MSLFQTRATESLSRRAWIRPLCWSVALTLGLTVGAAAFAAKAEPSYPFEGTWIKADRVCGPASTRVRTYTAREVVSSRSRCSIRRIASGSGSFELLEECHRGDRPQTVTETLRMLSPNSMTLRRQLVRLKIPRTIRYSRCTVAAPPLAHGLH